MRYSNDIWKCIESKLKDWEGAREGLGGLDEGGEHVLGHVGLPFVHVLHQALEVIEINILHDNHGGLVVEEWWFEQLLETDFN